MHGIGLKTTITRTGVANRTAYLNTSLNDVSPGYFDAMGMRLLEGRDLLPGDSQDNNHKYVVVNHAFVHAFFGLEDPIGKDLRDRH